MFCEIAGAKKGTSMSAAPSYPPLSPALTVHDAAADFNRAIQAGAEVLRPLTNEFYGHRSGTLRDPFGHEWTVSQELERLSPEEMQRRWNAMVAEVGKSVA
jgi:uncharacterized glyoxalase superfamily protein PhnB